MSLCLSSCVFYWKKGTNFIPLRDGRPKEMVTRQFDLESGCNWVTKLTYEEVLFIIIERADQMQ